MISIINIHKPELLANYGAPPCMYSVYTKKKSTNDHIQAPLQGGRTALPFILLMAPHGTPGPRKNGEISHVTKLRKGMNN